MMKVTVNFPAHQLDFINRRAKEQGISTNESIRRCIDLAQREALTKGRQENGSTKNR